MPPLDVIVDLLLVVGTLCVLLLGGLCVVAVLILLVLRNP